MRSRFCCRVVGRLCCDVSRTWELCWIGIARRLAFQSSSFATRRCGVASLVGRHGAGSLTLSSLSSCRRSLPCNSRRRRC
jgi:hypothetical protein